MLVTLAGFDIMRGRALLRQSNADYFAHVILACLFHDIGYVRGILEADDPDGGITDGKGNKIRLPRGSSDAALTPYPVDRSKLYVMERIKSIKVVDASARHRIHAVSCTARTGGPAERGRFAGACCGFHWAAWRSALPAQRQPA